MVIDSPGQSMYISVYNFEVSDTDFWTDWSLWKADLNFSNRQVIKFSTFDAPINPLQIALDQQYSKLYWFEDVSDMIMRTDLKTLQTDVALSGGLADLSGIAVDASAGKIYWSDQSAGKVHRSNLDGTDREVFLSGFISPNHLLIAPGVPEPPAWLMFTVGGLVLSCLVGCRGILMGRRW
jgi:hypothetical protein